MSKQLTQNQLTQLRALGAEVLSLIAAGEHKAEIIRKVTFELPDFRAYDIFNLISKSSQSQNANSQYFEQIKSQSQILNKENMSSILQHQLPSDKPQNQHEIVIDDRSLFCFFKKAFQPEILESDILDSESKFLIKITDTQNSGTVQYEDFLSFILPRTKKKFSKNILKKVRKHLNPSSQKSYDAICSIGRLFEKEVEILRLIQAQIKKYQRKYKNELQISDLFSAMDLKCTGRLTKKQMRQLIEINGGYQVQDIDILAILRRLDTDNDGEISFSDFFQNILPYFLFTQPELTKTQKRTKSQADQSLINRSYVGAKIQNSSNSAVVGIKQISKSVNKRNTGIQKLRVQQQQTTEQTYEDFMHQQNENFIEQNRKCLKVTVLNDTRQSRFNASQDSQFGDITNQTMRTDDEYTNKNIAKSFDNVRIPGKIIKNKQVNSSILHHSIIQINCDVYIQYSKIGSHSQSVQIHDSSPSVINISTNEIRFHRQQQQFSNSFYLENKLDHSPSIYQQVINESTSKVHFSNQ